MNSTPGYRSRLQIFFQIDKNGKKVAYRWVKEQIRAFRISLVEAEHFVAQGQADLLPKHPLK